MGRFKKGEWRTAYPTLLFDLNRMKAFRTNKKDFENAFELLKGNLIDLYGGKKNENL